MKELEDDGWVCWRPPAAKYAGQDIFDLFDLICIRDGELKFVQVKSGDRGYAHVVKKIKQFPLRRTMKISRELWHWKELKSKVGWKKTKI